MVWSGLCVRAGQEENGMRIAKENIPVRIGVPGAVARQQPDFGDATGYGKIGAEYFSLGAGADIAPLLKGLEGDLCQSPHWGYLLQGEVTVTYGDGAEEIVNGGDLFYWPPGHTVRVGTDAEVILFSPQDEHGVVIDHLRKKMEG
jgi:uncharacterized cupin superfamily protein